MDRIRPLISLFVVAGIIFAADQIIKTWVVNNIEKCVRYPCDMIVPIEGFERIFRLVHLTNSGAAFGLFQNSGIVFVVVAFVVTGAIIYFYPMVTNQLVRFSLGLQLGGALGNLWDRIFNNGEVVDYADLGFWPIFNVSDVSIVTGVTILAIWLWQQEDDQVSLAS